MAATRRRFLLSAGFGGLAVAVAAAGRAQPAVEFAESRVVVETAGGSFPFAVELALTEEQHQRGLQGRRLLAPDRGMLFDFGRPRSAAMWMKDTYVSLDMLFIAADGRIVNIAESTQPLSLAVIPSAAPVRGVLEVPAGTARRFGIKPGDRVVHPIFSATPGRGG
jgi:uncharacterized membrane protein (UPF0127 family)